MAFGMLQPLQNLRVMGMVTGIFTEGELQYVQEAYQSGNVFRAAAATFMNNYVYQTLVLTLGISLLPFAPGVFKTVMSFGLVGFAMAPNAVGTANGYSFHSLTMVFELEAYIVACFCALYWVRQFFLASYQRDLRAAGRGLSVMAGGVLVTAIMLAFAALYEAASLIGAGVLAEMGSAL
jgi:hypothetical protein